MFVVFRLVADRFRKVDHLGFAELDQWMAEQYAAGVESVKVTDENSGQTIVYRRDEGQLWIPV